MSCPSSAAASSPHGFQEERQVDRLFSGDNSIVCCEGALNTSYGQTAHGLVPRNRSYHVLSRIDSLHAGRDARDVLDLKPTGVPMESDPMLAARNTHDTNPRPTHPVIGLA